MLSAGKKDGAALQSYFTDSDVLMLFKDVIFWLTLSTKISTGWSFPSGADTGGGGGALKKEEVNFF